MGMTKKLYVCFLTAFISLFFGTPVVFSTTVDEIAQELTCTCGCNMLVSACEGTMECTAAADIKNQILGQLRKGLSKEAILASFVSRHGEKILSSPTKRGFNLTAWILPFVAIFTGIGVLYALLKNWASRKRPAGQGPLFPKEDRTYLDKIEEELTTFET